APGSCFCRAADGMRAWHVTGVQTCALPIYEGEADGRRIRWTEIREHGRMRAMVRIREMAPVLDLEALERAESKARPVAPAPVRRSAARRAGKKWRRRPRTHDNHTTGTQPRC